MIAVQGQNYLEIDVSSMSPQERTDMGNAAYSVWSHGRPVQGVARRRQEDSAEAWAEFRVWINGLRAGVAPVVEPVEVVEPEVEFEVVEPTPAPRKRRAFTLRKRGKK